MNKKRYDSIDAFRFVAMFMVLILHGNSPESFEVPLCVIARIGVPYFFLVSGFFSVHETDHLNEREKRLRKAKKLFILLIEIAAVYYLYWIIKVIIGKVDIVTFLDDFNIEFWLLNISFMVGHLWFIRALIYLEVIYATKFSDVLKHKKGWMLALILWGLDVVFMKYGMFFFGVKLPDYCYEAVTKFFGTAIVYYTLGYHARIHETRIRAMVNKIKPVCILAWIFTLCVLNVMEYRFLEHQGMNTMPCNYLFNFFICMSIFLTLLSYPDVMKGTKICDWGRRYSGYVYYWHILVLAINGMILKRLHVPALVYGNPLLLSIETMVCIWFYLMLQGKYTKRRL